MQPNVCTSKVDKLCRMLEAGLRIQHREAEGPIVAHWCPSWRGAVPPSVLKLICTHLASNISQDWKTLRISQLKHIWSWSINSSLPSTNDPVIHFTLWEREDGPGERKRGYEELEHSNYTALQRWQREAVNTESRAQRLLVLQRAAIQLGKDKQKACIHLSIVLSCREHRVEVNVKVCGNREGSN